MADFDHAAFAQQNVNSFLNRAQRSGGKPKEAKFAAPEAAVTALGVGAILGGPAGIVAGLAQGILGKRDQQKVNDALFAERQALDAVDLTVSNAIENSREIATSPEDQQYLDTLAAQQFAAYEMQTSGIPELQQQGAALQANVLAEHRAFSIRQEEQRIARGAAEVAAERELGQEHYNRYKDSRDNFAKESAPYLEVRNATVNLLGALDRGTAVDQYAAVKLLEKALDPSSVVRPEEQEAWGALGSALDRAGVFVERLKSGKTLSAEQVRDIKNLALGIERQSYEMQAEREARYLDEITDIGLPGKYHNNFRLSKPLTALAPAAAPSAAAESGDEDGPGVAEYAVAAGLAGADALAAVPSEVKTGAAAAGGLTVARWAPALTRIAAKFGLPVAAVLAAGEQLPGESDEAYRHRLRRMMESTEYDERRRPIND